LASQSSEHEELLRENEELKHRLREAEETLDAIRSGEVDAILVEAPGGEERLFTLEAADHVYRTFLESITEGALTLSGDGYILYANEAAAELLRGTNGGPLGQPLRHSVREDDRERFDALLAAARHQPSGAEIMLDGPDGGHAAYLSLHPLDGQDNTIVAVLTDLSERKKTARALEAERLADAIFDQAGEAIIVCDSNGVIVRASRAVTSLVGGDPLFRARAEALPLRTIQGEAWLLEDDVRFEPAEGVEVELDHPDGSVHHLIMNADPLTTGEEGFVGSVMTLTDITERKHMEQAIRAQAERFRLLLASSSDSISIQNRDLRYEWVTNPALGLAVEDLVGKTDQDLIDADQFEAVRTLKERVMKSGEELRVEVPLKDAEGNVSIWEGTYAPRRDEGGEVTGIYSYFKDITERKQAEAKVLESEAEKAAHRERLRLARDLHDSVTQALFAASLKAEALAIEGMVTGKARDVVEDVNRLSRGALAQMRTMLLELRGEGVEEVPIRQLLHTVAEATEGRSSVKVSLQMDGDGDPPEELHRALYRITQEALNNVAKHAQAKNVRVTLDMTESLVSLVVEDDGRGFEPGSVDPSHLGLRTMKERAQEAKAALSISSAPGEGTIIRLTWRQPVAGD